MLAPQEECYCDMPQNWQLFFYYASIFLPLLSATVHLHYYLSDIVL